MRNGGLGVGIRSKVSFSRGAAGIVEAIAQILCADDMIDPKVMLAMDLFAAARLEMTERARFVGLVSSIEPLAVQERHDEVEPVIKQALVALENTQTIGDDLRRSLEGRISDLRRESVAFGIRRLMERILPGDKEGAKTITNAYNVRSKLVHDGQTDADLVEIGLAFERVMRRVFSATLKRELLVAA